MHRQHNAVMKAVVAATFIAMIAVNILANLLPINGITTGAVSDSYPNLFAPAGFAFSIWGVIYALLAAHVLFQLGLLRGKDADVNEASLSRTGVLLSISSVINSAWVFSWHYELIPLSMTLITCLLVCLILISSSLHSERMTMRERLFHRLPFSIYFGWITVATISNATTMLVSVGWDAFGMPESTWAVIMLVVGALIGTATALRFNDVAYGLVLIWAYFGILIKHTSSAEFAGRYTDVIMAAAVCIAILAATSIYNALPRKRGRVVRSGP